MKKIPLSQYKQAFREVVMEDLEISFIVHLLVYALVNAMLIFINLLYDRETLWFVASLLGWGLGLALHYLFGCRWLFRFLKKLEVRAEIRITLLREKTGGTGEITQPEYKAAFRQVVKEISTAGFRVHAIVFLVINILLTITDFVYTPRFVWFFFPLMGWGIGLILHYLFGCRWVERILKTLEMVAENKAREACIYWLSVEQVPRNFSE